MSIFKKLLPAAMPRPPVATDSLLAAANFAILILRIGLIVGMIGAGFTLIVNIFGLGAFLTGFGHPPPGASVGLSLRIILYLGLGLAALGFINSFFMHLTRMIATVGLGTPFVAENADRLTRMGWLMLWAQMIAIPMGLVASSIGPAFIRPAFQSFLGFSWGGVILALTMFVLARIFRMGTQMNDEIEGTV